MIDSSHAPFDEEAAMEAARENNAASLRDVLRREHHEMLRKGPRNAQVERRMLEIDEEIARDLERLRK
ncbi:MAG: hypothetical protein ABSD75_24585 [Terriglobales bacterium]|jgi:hypothetical protein